MFKRLKKPKKDDLDISLGTIIDNDLDFLKNHLLGKDLGYVISVKNLLAVTYDELVNRKNGVIEKRKGFEQNNDAESVEGCDIMITQIYSKLQSVEDKYLYLKERIEEVQKAVNQGKRN